MRQRKKLLPPNEWRNMKVNFYTILFYIAYMQSLNMHLLYTSFLAFLSVFLSIQKIISLVFPFLLKTFLKTKEQKPPGKKTSVDYHKESI